MVKTHPHLTYIGSAGYSKPCPNCGKVLPLEKWEGEEVGVVTLWPNHRNEDNRKCDGWSTV